MHTQCAAHLPQSQSQSQSQSHPQSTHRPIQAAQAHARRGGERGKSGVATRRPSSCVPDERFNTPFAAAALQSPCLFLALESAHHSCMCDNVTCTIKISTSCSQQYPSTLAPRLRGHGRADVEGKWRGETEEGESQLRRTDKKTEKGRGRGSQRAHWLAFALDLAAEKECGLCFRVLFCSTLPKIVKQASRACFLTHHNARRAREVWDGVVGWGCGMGWREVAARRSD